MKFKAYQLTAVLCLSSLFSLAQSIPVCGQKTLYQSGVSGCIWKRESGTTNMTGTGCPSLPTSASGIAIGPAFSFSAPSQCYWTVGQSGTYCYYNGSAWVNTGHSAGGLNFTNPGAGASVIYNFDNTGQVSVYNGTGNATVIATYSNMTSNDAVQDIAADQFNNYYLLKASTPQKLFVYNSLGVQTCSYTVVGADFGGGLALSAGKVHIQTNNNAYSVGSLNSGTITFTAIGPANCNTNDLANCAGDAGIYSDITAVSSSSLSCAISSVTLLSADPSSVLNYTWTGPGISGAINSPSIVASAAGVYVRKVVDCAGIESTSNFTVGYNAAIPPVQALQSGTVYCQGSSPLVLSVTGLGNYQWSPATGLSATTGSLVQANPNVTTTYTVSASLNNCVNQTVLTIVSVPSVTPSVVTSSATICLGSATSMTAQGAATYTWLPVNVVGSNITVSPTSSTMYTVLAVDQNGCTGQNTIPISVVNYPIINLELSSTEICETETVSISANGAQSYTLAPGIFMGPLNTIMPTSTTVFTVTGKNWECVSTTTVQISVKPLPQLSMAATRTMICAGEPVSFVVTGGASYNWMSGQTGSFVTLAPQQSSVISVVGFDPNGCSSTATVQVQVSKCTSIANASNDLKLSVYPSPAKGHFFVELSDIGAGTSLEIYNVLGAKVLSQTIISEKTEVSTQTLSAGLYYISIQQADRKALKRLVVE